MEDLQDTLYFSLGDERHCKVGSEALICQQLCACKDSPEALQIADLDDTPFPGCPAGIPFPDVHAGGFDIPRPEALPGCIFQLAADGLQQQDIGCIHAQLPDDLIEQDLERDLQVENIADRQVDGAQGCQPFQLLDGLLMQVHAVDRVPPDLG